MTIVVDGPLLAKGGTVVVLVRRIDQPTFDKRYVEAVTVRNGRTALQATANGVVTFLEFDAPPGFEYRFRTRDGKPVAQHQVSAGEGGGYIDATTGQFATSDVTFHHHIAGPQAQEANSRALDGSSFRIDPASCRVQPAVRVCSGSTSDLDRMLRVFERSKIP